VRRKHGFVIMGAVLRAQSRPELCKNVCIAGLSEESLERIVWVQA